MSASPAAPRESTPSTSTSTAPTATGPFASARKSAPPPPKPINVFSSDGSFLERFKKQNEEATKEKQKQEEALARKRAADSRFKNRGKRPTAPTTTSTSEDGSAPKKSKKDETEGLSEYQKEVKKLSARSLQDEGAGMRPLMK